MKKNLHSFDKIIRILLAVVLGVLIFSGTLTGLAGILLGIFAVVFLATGIVGFCPLYKVIGVSTLKEKSKTA